MNNISKTAKLYRSGKITRREFLKEAGIYIVKYPHFLGHHDNDLRHEFYAYVASKLDRIIAKYDNDENISFLIWFNKVLQNQFISFIKYLKNKNSLEQQFNTNYGDCEYYADEQTENDSMEIDLSDLSENEKKIIFMKYGFDDSLLSDRSILTKKLEKKKNMEERLSRKYIRLLKIQKAIVNETDPDKKNRLIVEELRVKRSKRIIERVLQSLSLNLPINMIEKESGIKSKTISTYISRVKKKLRNKGSEKHHCRKN